MCITLTFGCIIYQCALANYTCSLKCLVIFQSEPFGSVYCVKNTGEVVKVDTGFVFSNGIAVQDDQHGRPSKLIVAETGRKTLWAYDIKESGKAENKRHWAKIPGQKNTFF